MCADRYSPREDETEKTTGRVDGAKEIIDSADVRNAITACRAARVAGQKVK